MKFTYKKIEDGVYEVFNGAVKVGEIYKSSFANFYIVEATKASIIDQGYATLKEAKMALNRMIEQ